MSQPSKEQAPLPPYRRPLTFAEALRFTPLTTSPLQPSDQIPLPRVGHQSQHVPFTSAVDRKVVAGIKITPKVHDELQRLLEAQSLSEFKFKRQPKPNSADAPAPELSTLARHVYEGNPLDVAYRPDSTQPLNAQFPVTKAKAAHDSAFQQNFILEVPNKQPVANSATRPVIQIRQPEGFRPQDYARAPDSPKRRKLDNGDLDAARALRQRTQRELGDHSLHQLQNLLDTISQARSQFEDAGTEFAGPQVSALLEPGHEDDDLPYRLTSSALEKLRARLSSLVDLKRLGEVSQDDIQQLRQLCEGSIKRTQTLNLRLEDNPTEEEVEEWQKRLIIAESGLGSASVYLFTAMGDKPVEVDADILMATTAALENVFDSCLVPVIQSRPDGQSAYLFQQASRNEAILKRLLDAGRKLLEQLSLACVQVSEASICQVPTEFLAARLIFVQNSNKEKTAAMNPKAYERTRKSVMSSLARLFAAFPGDRKPILDEILVSLDKVPSTSRSARQYTLGEGKNVMLVSALLLQLVQTCVLGSGRRTRSRLRNRSDDHSDSNDVDSESESDQAAEPDAVSSLRNKADELYSAAFKTSQEIVYYLIDKASGVSKTGDSPYRNILDLFIEDLVTLLLLPEWPAAALTLEVVFQRMTLLARTDKAAGVKNMALESLGTAALLDKGDGASSDVAGTLVQFTNDQFSRTLSAEELLGPQGPFVLTCRHYNLQHAKKDAKTLRSRSSHSFFLAQYATMFCRRVEHDADDAQSLLDEIEEASSETSSVAHIDEIMPREAQLAYTLSVLNLPICQRYGSIAQTLLASLSSEQAHVRSRSIKSIVTMLETDPSLLDSQELQIDQYIFPCASDDSALVRDAALSLIFHFLISRPAYEERGFKKLIECTKDDKIGVQKRSIGHLAEIYARDARPYLRASIAETFLRRTLDVEESVAELACRSLLDAWFTSNFALAKEARDSARAVVAIEDLTAHMVATLDRDRELLELPPLLTRFLLWQSKDSKAAADFNELLSRISERLFNIIIAAQADPSSLELLVCLAEARPQSLAPAQLSHLRQYLKFSNSEDLKMFKAVLAIFQHVLPHLSSSHHTLLDEIRGDIRQSITKLRLRSDLDQVFLCLRAIEDVVPMPERYVAMIRSIIGQLDKASSDQRRRFIVILGSLGKHLDVEKFVLRGLIDSYKGGPIAGFLADTVYPYVTRPDTEAVQLTALDSLGCICQASPAQYTKGRVLDLFIDCLQQTDGSSSRSYALRTFHDLFTSLSEPQAESGESKEDADTVQDLKRMGGNNKVQGNSSATSQLATKIFGPIKKIALETLGSDLLLAGRTIASMSKHGMFHPKDYAGVFIALQTAQDPDVRELFNQAHAKSHGLHESVWEREYVGAVQEAFRYQFNTAEDPSGSHQGQAKLAACFATINTSGSKYVKKFVSNIITRINTDPAKIDISEPRPYHLLFVRFVAQNLAFFDYTKMEDLLHTILQLEIVFSKNGGEIAQAIESTLPLTKASTPDATVNGIGDEQVVVNGEDSTAVVATQENISAIDQDRLKRLATAACAVTVISEARSHLKRQYGITRDVRATMAQNQQAKEKAKVPVKVHGITGERFWSQTTAILSSLDSPEAMLQRCRDFHGLMNVDEDVIVGDDGEEAQTSIEGDGYMAPTPKGKKRKANGSVGGTPRKRGRPKKTTTPSRRSSSASSRDDPDADFMG
ncbi:Protein rad9 [Cyphellophora attinorum]|uniref:Sister chromatid cohesion protein n=1 Tax=Cyphellophora attinorum TaxID=1664694 RepID=A0A0N1H4A9_9EURO|nr:Protein rad9 [Phialophora attinorum]KPI35490.1 Protein rad9 [Phialophora attinorum]